MERPRRRRRTEALRRLVREHELSAGDLIQPIFVVHGTRVEREIASMPGVHHLSVDESLDREADRIQRLGIPAVILFGLAFDVWGTYDIAFTASFVFLFAASLTVLGIRERRFSVRYVMPAEPQPAPVLAAGGGS